METFVEMFASFMVFFGQYTGLSKITELSKRMCPAQSMMLKKISVRSIVITHTHLR